MLPIFNRLLSSLVAGISSLLLWLGLRVVVALWLGRVTPTCWCSSILGLACSWISWLRRLRPSWTLASHLVLNCFGLLHLANAAIILGPLCRVVWSATATWLRSCGCRSCWCRRASPRRSWRVASAASLLLLNHLGLPGHAQAAIVV